MLGIWMYSWTESDWTGVQPPTPSPPPAALEGVLANAGGGKKQRSYERLGEGFWMLRERYLRRFLPKEPEVIKSVPATAKQYETKPTDVSKLEGPAPGEVDGGLLLLQQALHAAHNRARAAENAAVLRDAMQRAQQLQLDISKIQQQNYSRAIALLLLDAD